MNTKNTFKKRVYLDDGLNIFGIRSLKQVRRDLGYMVNRAGDGFQFSLSTLGFMRPDVSIPTYLGKTPKHRLAPIIHCYDRNAGGQHYSQRVTRKDIVDFRGEHLGYDEHDGIDFCCPVGTELTAAASGHVVMIRDNWLRGGITLAVDHGDGLITQYTHCWKPLVTLGQAVKRGEPVALSGSAGVDMVISFPWVSPHIHFMVWDHGKPVDPYLAPGEKDRTGTWHTRNTPCHQHEIEETPEYSAVDEAEIQKVINRCNDDRIKKELKELNGNPHYLAAYLEDALHHDRYAWEQEHDPKILRPVSTHNKGMTKISLPLTATKYDGAFLADNKINPTGFWE